MQTWPHYQIGVMPVIQIWEAVFGLGLALAILGVDRVDALRRHRRAKVRVSTRLLRARPWYELILTRRGGVLAGPGDYGSAVIISIAVSEAMGERQPTPE